MPELGIQFKLFQTHRRRERDGVADDDDEHREDEIVQVEALPGQIRPLQAGSKLVINYEEITMDMKHKRIVGESYMKAAMDKPSKPDPDCPQVSSWQVVEYGRSGSMPSRVWIGILAACLLHQTICTVVRSWTESLRHRRGDPTADPVILSDLLWFLFWLCASALLWRCKRPRPIEWALPFTLFFGIYLFAKSAGYWQADHPGDEHFARFSEAMYYAAGAKWITGLVLAYVRTRLGEGKQQFRGDQTDYGLGASGRSWRR